jgi:ABC-type bacteriocin/lantibiotic exporters, contain an N-terminal double-glycine peptidase domain
MDFDFLESQVDKRRRMDEEMYEDAFSDLASVLGIRTLKKQHETNGAVEEILSYMDCEIPEVPENLTEINSRLEYMLRPSGTMKRRVELYGNWWKNATGCFLGSTKDGDVIALIPGKWGGYRYKDKTGKILKINKNTAKNINTDAFCFYKAFPLKKLGIRDLIAFMLKGIPKADIIYVFLAFFIVQLLGMFTAPYITKFIYGTLIPSGSAKLILPVTSFLIGIGLGQIIIGTTKSIILGKFLRELNIMVNSAVMMRMFSLPAKFFKNYSSGELSSRMGYISSLCQTVVGDIFPVLLTAVFSLGYFVQMYQFASALVFPGLLTILASIILSVFFTFMQQGIIKKKLELSPKLQSFVYALYGGMQKIKITGAEKRAFAKWAEKYSEVERLEYSPPLILKIQSVISLAINSLGTIAIYYFTAKSGISTDNYYAFNTAYGMASSAITALSSVALQIANLEPIVNMIKPVLNEEPETGLNQNIVTHLQGNIEINNLRFRYTEDSPFVLNGINLKIKKGEYVAIVGKTGCGKSTLLRLLLGFEKPISGGIYYDGKDLNSLDLKSMRQKIGVVMQNGSLFPGDIFSNIIVTSPWKTLPDAWEAAELAGIKEDIEAMPMGMHTLISEGAGGLSGGQKQRIMIARALISKPSLVFFDEATSALDNITQKHVSDSIASLNCTRLVIAHRLSTIKHCDRIIVLNHGNIAEEGKYEELMEKKGEFHSLAIRQISE